VGRWLQTRSVFVFIITLGLFTMAARPATDPDMWWHLRTGQLILQTDHIFHSDPYSFTCFGHPWINHEWLSDVTMFAIYRAAGWSGLIVVFALVIAAALLLVFQRSEGQPYVAGMATIWAAFACAPTWGVRPQMFSFFLAGLLLLVLEASYERPLLLVWSVPLTLLWVNLHAGYAMGIGLLVLFLFGDVLDSAFGVAPWRQNAKHIRTLGLITLGCIAVVPLNPYGVKMYLYPFRTLGSPAMQAYIAEWASPNFHEQKYWPLLFLILATAVLPWFSPRRLRPRELLLLLVLTFAALASIRHICIYVLVAAPLVSALVWDGSKFSAQVARSANAHLPGTRAIVNAACALGFLAFTVIRVYSVTANQKAAEAKSFPSGAVAFFETHHPLQPLLNYYTWGGYFIWKLYPEYRVFIDGRADVYGDALMDQFAATYYIRASSWQQNLEHWGIRTVVLPPNAPLISALRISPRWREVYADSQATVFALEP